MFQEKIVKLGRIEEREKHMAKRIIVSGAGGGGSNNLIRSLRESKLDLFIVGTNINRFYLKRSIADKNYLIPRGTDENYIPAINKLIQIEDIDLVIPNNDTEVRSISENREKIDARIFLPKKGTVRVCQDKLLLYEALRKHGVNVAKTVQLRGIDNVDQAFEELSSTGEKLWCRMRLTSGSKGSLPVNKPEQVRFWVKYWEEMRGVSSDSFLLSEFLPGRDFAFQSIWKNDEVILGKTCERLSYVFGKLMPSGSSSTPQVGKLVYNREVIETCINAVKAVDKAATGNFCIDLKENAREEPCVTEINVGRFFMITNVFNLVGRYNMAEIYVKLAFDERVEVEENLRFRDVDENVYLLRELDTLPLLSSEEDIENSYIKFTHA